ncbi:acyltransferase family protein [Rhodococcoides fascians]|uniref:O-acetyltransferase OatA n=1 Tax=Rhodococcoides fascians TaxID=1828 RepID=A0A143QKX2_RHOFA|nr:acyltransferase family protein [Rhodococcus fascians]AMY23436.1 O-acetyltransferase OatA [Rhodococcus fascians]OZC38437.1 acyltransferase [Rhodococcus fascians]
MTALLRDFGDKKFPHRRSADKTSASFRPDIQGLRMVAVVLVVLDHLFRWPSGGFIGVDVFFVISGFLITGLLLKEGDKSGSISIRGFYKRRIRRIIPMSLLVIAITVTASYVLLLTERFNAVASDALWSLVFLVNWHLASGGTDYFQSDLPPSPLQHYWSLAVEEQFYVLWPLLILLVLLVAKRTGRAANLRPYGIGFALTVIAVSFGWALLQTSDAPTVAYFSTFTRAWELGVGALLAASVSFFTRLPVFARNVMCALGLAGIGVSAFVITDQSPFPAPIGALPVLATALVIASGIGVQQVAASRIISLTPFLYIGTISYSLYLWHWPVIVILEAVMDRGLSFYIAAIVLMSALTVGGYHLIEQPILRSQWLLGPSLVSARKSRRSGKISWNFSRPSQEAKVIGVGALAVAVALGCVFALNPKAPETAAAPRALTPIADAGSNAPDPLAVALREATSATSFPALSPSFDNVQASKAPEMEPEAGCLAPDDLTNYTQCTYGPADAPRTALVVGDSIGISWMPGVRAALEPLGFKVHGVGLTSCPFANVDVLLPNNPEATDRCNTERTLIYDQINALRPEILVVSSSVYGIGNLASGAKSVAAQQEWTVGTADAINRVRDSGARIVILGPNPPGPAASECVTALSEPNACFADPAGDWAIKKQAESAAVNQSDANYVDTQKWFCAGSQCPIFAAGTPIRWDRQHLTASYGQLLAPYIAAELMGA